MIPALRRTQISNAGINDSGYTHPPRYLLLVINCGHLRCAGVQFNTADGFGALDHNTTGNSNTGIVAVLLLPSTLSRSKSRR
jgi:hypothetical protein